MNYPAKNKTVLQQFGADSFSLPVVTYENRKFSPNPVFHDIDTANTEHPTESIHGDQCYFTIDINIRNPVQHMIWNLF